MLGNAFKNAFKKNFPTIVLPVKMNFRMAICKVLLYRVQNRW